MRVAIAENAPLFLPALVDLVTATGHDVVLAVPDGTTLMERLQHVGVDVAILDVSMPPGDHGGLTTADELRQRYPNMGILFLSQYDQPYFLRLAIPAGRLQRVGYWTKEGIPDVEVLGRALTTIAAGGLDVEPRLVSLIGTSTNSPIDQLTSREREALSLLHDGYGNAAIAGRMAVSVKSLEGYLRSVYLKLGIAEESEVNPRVRAAAFYDDFLRSMQPPR